MKCIDCGTSHTHVVETRKENDGMLVRRRHECGNGHRFNTYQMHENLARSVGMVQLRAKLPPIVAGIERRRDAWQRRTVALRMRAAGKTSGQVAMKLNISDARVRQIWKENQ